MLKAIESFIQRNVELQANCQEQKALTATYKQKMEAIESEKNTQVKEVDKYIICIFQFRRIYVVFQQAGFYHCPINGVGDSFSGFLGLLRLVLYLW